MYAVFGLPCSGTRVTANVVENERHVVERRGREQVLHLCVCVCLRECVCERERESVCVCVCEREREGVCV